MTNKHKRSKQQQAARSAGARAASPATSSEAQAAPRRGLLDSILAPRVAGSTAMPSIRASLARGFTVICGTPALAVGVVLVVIAQWLGALALGYEGPFALFVSALDTALAEAEAGVTVLGQAIDLPSGTRIVVVSSVMALVLILRPGGLTGGREFSLPRVRAAGAR